VVFEAQSAAVCGALAWLKSLGAGQAFFSGKPSVKFSNQK